jgi:hypothetical protein
MITKGFTPFSGAKGFAIMKTASGAVGHHHELAARGRRVASRGHAGRCRSCATVCHLPDAAIGKK